MHLSFPGAYVPLTKEGNIMVNGVLASCYPFTNHYLAHISMTLMQLFPRVTELIFGYDNGLQAYVNTLDSLGKWVLPNMLQNWDNLKNVATIYFPTNFILIKIQFFFLFQVHQCHIQQFNFINFKKSYHFYTYMWKVCKALPMYQPVLCECTKYAGTCYIPDIVPIRQRISGHLLFICIAKFTMQASTMCE